MNTKSIALESTTYNRLATYKRAGESFSEVIDRLLSEVAGTHTGRDILDGLEGVKPLSEEDVEQFLAVTRENRETETWGDAS